MTIEGAHHAAPLHWMVGALLLTLLSAGCAAHESRRGDSVDVSNYPPEIRESYQVFAVRCSRCHTLARPLNARINDAQHWIRYVNRMRLQPGSGIDAANAKVILRFLLYYHDHESSHGAEAPSAPAAAPEAAPAEAPAPVAPAVPPSSAAPSNGAEAPSEVPESNLQDMKRQPRHGAIAPSVAADGRQS
jgi:hypothetical protein